MNDRPRLDVCRAARLPTGGLVALAHLRAKGGIRVIAGEIAWVNWDGDQPDVVAAVLTVPGAELFEPRDGKWFRSGAHMPTFDGPPPGEAVSLDRAIVPSPFVAVEAASREHRRVPLRLIRSEAPRPTSALRCAIAVLEAWADTATTADIAAVKGARCGDRVWLVGKALPAVTVADRFWGEQVLIPLGWRTEPDWPEYALREAAGVGPNEVLILTADGSEAIPDQAFRPLTRSAIRRTTA